MIYNIKLMVKKKKTIKIKYDQPSGKISGDLDQRKVYICIPNDYKKGYRTSYLKDIDDDRVFSYKTTLYKSQAIVETLPDAVKTLAYIRTYIHKAYLKDLRGKTIDVDINPSRGSYVNS